MNLNEIPGLPGKSSYYAWWSDVWQHMGDNTYAYDAKGRLIETIAMDPNSSTNQYRETYNYDQYDNQTDYLFYIWAEQWELNYGTGTIFGYTPEGYIIEETHQFYDNLSGWVLTSHLIRIFDDEGKLLEEVFEFWEEDEWMKYYKDVFEYDDKSNGFTTVTSYSWNFEDWEEEYRVIDIEWISFEEFRVASAVSQENYNGTWYDLERFTGTVDGPSYTLMTEFFQGNDWVPWYRETETLSPFEEVYLTEYYDQFQMVWNNSERETTYMDETGYYSGQKFEYWAEDDKSSKGQWHIEYFDNWINSYTENGQLEETIIQYWDLANEILVNSSRFTYSEFSSSDVPELGLDIGLKIYPNPVINDLQIIPLDNPQLEYRYQLLDLAGKVIRDEGLQSGQSAVNMNGLDRGMYLLRVHSEEAKTSTYKILKQ